MKKLLLVGLLVLSFSASAIFYNGNDLNQWAEGDARISSGRIYSGDSEDSAQLSGYVAAVYEMGSKVFFCPPKTGTVTLGQVKDIVAKYVKDHPEHRNQAALDLAIDALEHAFPCEK